MPGTTTQLVDDLLERRRSGDPAARDALIEVAQRRLHLFVRTRLGKAIRTFVQSEDVAQAASMRLRQALEAESVQPEDAADFFKLAARHIHFEICELAKQLRRRPAPLADGAREPSAPGADDPARRLEGAEIMLLIGRAVDELPDDLREVMRLLYYLELPRAEVAQALGISESTVGRYHLQAKLLLATRLSPDQLSGGI